MQDYVFVIGHIPLYTGHLCVSLWAVIYHLPWPTADDWFRWFLFLILGKAVWYVISSRSMPRRRKYAKRVSENGAAASISTLFEHH